MNAQHTPTPWTQRGESVVAQRDHVCGGINEESVHAMTRAPAERIANAAFIVRACNSHDALVAALRELEREISAKHAHELHANHPDFIQLNRRVADARAALAAAGEGE